MSPKLSFKSAGSCGNCDCRLEKASYMADLDVRKLHGVAAASRRQTHYQAFDRRG